MKQNIRFFQMMMLAIIFFMASCKTPTAYFNKGDYDASVVEAIEKLAKRKKNKRKHVEIVEEAFRKVTTADMNQIESLKAEGRTSNWVRINSIHNQIKDRQELIAPYLPLVAKDGYKAEFQFVKVNGLERESRKKAAEYYYITAINYMQKAEQGDKYAARKAYANFGKISKYYDQYKNTATLRDQAYQLGQTYVLFDTENASNTFLPRDFERELAEFNIHSYNTTWTKYIKNRNAAPHIDYEMLLQVTDIEISPELVNQNNFVERQEVEDGFDYVLDNDGNVLKDSLGNDVKTPRFVTVEAWVTEVHQHKAAHLRANLIVKNRQTNEIVRREPIDVVNIFENYASSFQGDRRALSTATCSRLGNSPLPFPDDTTMALDALENLRPALHDGIERVQDVAML